MPIQVTCPGCHKRFKVSDKYAGKKGPCPKCKAQIQIPELDEQVVVHEPEYGPTGVTGQQVLKPLARQEAKVSTLAVLMIVAAVVTVLVVTFLLRSEDGQVSPVLLGLGAALLGPPLALAGYSFLRNDELEPYRGIPRLVRSAICGLAFAALWGVYMGVKWYLFEGAAPEMFQLVFIVPVFVAAGAGIAAGCYDLDFASGAILYGMYLGVAVLLRLLLNMSPF